MDETYNYNKDDQIIMEELLNNPEEKIIINYDEIDEDEEELSNTLKEKNISQEQSEFNTSNQEYDEESNNPHDHTNHTWDNPTVNIKISIDSF